MVDWARYNRSHHQISGDPVPELLAEALVQSAPRTLADLGCGDGRVLASLEQSGLLPEEVWAIDLAPAGVQACEGISRKIRGIVGDVTNVAGLADASVDFVISSQVIEHLPDDSLLAPEIARILKPGGRFYVSSVLRRRRSWWVYRREGEWRLDPTHVREYDSEAQFVSALTTDELRVSATRSGPFAFALLDLALRAAVRARLLPHERLSTFYLRHPAARRARSIRLRPPGYRWIAAVGERVAA